MGLTFIANLPLVSPIGLGGLCPSVGLGLGAPSLTLSATLTGALALNASFSATPPTLGFYLTGLEAVGVNLTLGASLGVPDCSFGVNVAAGISVTANIAVSLNASLSIYLPALELLFGASLGVYAFTYVGPASGLGATLTTELASSWPDGVPSSGSCDALILVAPTAVASVLLAFLNGLGTPPPGLAYVAKLSALGDLAPSVSLALPQAEAALNASLSACASITASLTPQIDIPLPTLAITAEAVADVALPNLKAAISVAPPTLVLSATASLAASIMADAGALASLGLTLGRFDALFGVYTYSGTGTAFGAAVTAGITDTSDVTAIVLATTSPADFVVLTAFFGGAV
jgi:hypothetical protein